MIPHLIAAPAVEPVTVAEMRAYLRLDEAAEDDLVAALVKAARLLVEAACGRQLIEQTWRLALDGSPASRTVLLPVSPLIRVERIRVFAGGGVASELAAGLYRADPLGDPPRIVFDWRAIDPIGAVERIEIDVVAGFGPNGEHVPAPLIQAIRLLVARWFENRGDAPAPDAALPPDIAALVAPYRRARL